MTPKFAQAVDPIYLQVLGLLERIQDGNVSAPQEERLKIRALIDQAEAMVGNQPEWELARYALVSWIDEVLVDANWSGSDWWSNNVMEVELYNTRICYDQFYVRAQEASTLARRDALEVFYVCVVLGFRGLYRDVESATGLIQAHGLPPDLANWARQTSLAIRLGQGRPPMAAPRREIAGAPPLRTKSLVVWGGLVAVMLAASNVWYYFLYSSRS